jgi:hypothetical protein
MRVLGSKEMDVRCAFNHHILACLLDSITKAAQQFADRLAGLQPALNIIAGVNLPPVVGLLCRICWLPLF